MDSKHVIASGLADNELAKAFSELVAERWDSWDLAPFMVYLVDTCAPAVLPYLAEQFDIDGLRGFGMATNEAAQRDLIKRSIALHKFMGTPWAIREACRTVGFPVVLLEEGASRYHPRRGGFSRAYPRAYSSMKDAKPTPEDWACFRVLVEADFSKAVSADEARKLRLFVEFYKNERSHLVELGFFQLLAEKVFRPAVDSRDSLAVDLITLDLTPNPVVLNVAGAERTVKVGVNTPWSVDKVIPWANDANDCITIAIAGENEIRVSSTFNTTTNERERDVQIKTLKGLVLGTLTVRQKIKWSNAYSRAYSKAYTVAPYTVVPYVRTDKAHVWLAATPEHDEQICVESNTSWIIE